MVTPSHCGLSSDRGQVLIDGVDIAKISDAELREVRRKKIAMVFQSFALMPHMTVLDNTAFGMELAGFNAEERLEKALDALRQVGLEIMPTATRMNSLADASTCGISRALAINPDILLMDEAFSALDPLIRTEMQDELVKLQAKHQRTIALFPTISMRLCVLATELPLCKMVKWYRSAHRMKFSIIRRMIMSVPSSVALILVRYSVRKILPAGHRMA
ncbi:ATP-binding cassette domain-containing protein [Escherichia coli]